MVCFAPYLHIESMCQFQRMRLQFLRHETLCLFRVYFNRTPIFMREYLFYLKAHLSSKILQIELMFLRNRDFYLTIE